MPWMEYSNTHANNIILSKTEKMAIKPNYAATPESMKSIKNKNSLLEDVKAVFYQTLDKECVFVFNRYQFCIKSYILDIF